MDQPLRVIEGAYFRDILDQPRALEQTLSKLQSSPSLEAIERHLVEGWYKRVVLTGMGSSYHTLHPLHLRLVEAGIPAIMVDSSELLHYQRRVLEERTLLVLVSQSGRSAEIVRLLEATRGRLETLGVTNTPDSPLAQDTTAVVLTDAGEEAAPSPARATWRPRRLSRGWEPCSSAGASTAHAATLPAPFLWSRPTWRTGAPTWTSSHRCWTEFVPSTTSDVGRRWQPWAPRVSSRRRPPTSRPREWAAQLSATALWRC